MASDDEGVVGGRNVESFSRTNAGVLRCRRCMCRLLTKTASLEQFAPSQSVDELPDHLVVKASRVAAGEASNRYWWRIQSLQDFDNIGVSRIDEKSKRKYIFCPECEERILGYIDANGSVLISCDQVKQYEMDQVKDSEDFNILSGPLRRELEKLLTSQKPPMEYTVEFVESRIGLMLSDNAELTNIEVKAFTELNGELGPAEQTGKISVGDVLIKVNKEDVTSKGCSYALNLITQSLRPVSLTFIKSQDTDKNPKPRMKHVEWQVKS